MLEQAHTLKIIRAVTGRFGPELRALGVWAVEGPVPAGTLAAAGFPAVLPLWWNARDLVVGLRITPGEPLSRWRPVLVESGESTTLGENPGELLPGLLAIRVVESGTSALDRLRERWPTARAAARELQSALGGDPRLIDDAVQQAISAGDVGLPPAGASPDERPRGVWLAGPRGACLTALDLWLAAHDGSPEAPPPDPIELGPWWRRAAMRWAWTQFCNPGLQPVPRAVLEDLLLLDAGSDDGNVEAPPWSFRLSNGGAAEGALSSTAMLWEQGASNPTGDPAGEGVARALLDPAGTDGETHARAAVLLDERGDPQRAWGALCSAAWWAARSLGSTPPALSAGLRILAQRRGWEVSLEGLG